MPMNIVAAWPNSSSASGGEVCMSGVFAFTVWYIVQVVISSKLLI